MKEKNNYIIREMTINKILTCIMIYLEFAMSIVNAPPSFALPWECEVTKRQGERRGEKDRERDEGKERIKERERDTYESGSRFKICVFLK